MVMGEVSGARAEGGASRRGLGRLAAVLVAGAALGVLHACQKSASQTNGAVLGGPAHDGPLAKLAEGSMTKLSPWSAPQPGSTAAFDDRDGKPVNLSQFRGKEEKKNNKTTKNTPNHNKKPTKTTLQRK